MPWWGGQREIATEIQVREIKRVKLASDGDLDGQNLSRQCLQGRINVQNS